MRPGRSCPPELRPPAAFVRGSAPGSRASGSGSGACFAGPRFPWPLPLAPPPPQPAAQLCSAASQLLWQSLTSPNRASAATALRLPTADRQPSRACGRSGNLRVPVQGACVHARFSDHAGLAKCSRWRGHFAFHYTDSVGTRNHFSITFPCRRFADILADACARLGADVGRYSFIAVDLHHLLLAGLPAHPCEKSLPRQKPAILLLLDRVIQSLRHAEARATTVNCPM